MENEFKYILELEGKDYGKHVDRNEEYVSFVPFKEVNFFMSIEEAMDALILKGIRSFEEMSETTYQNRFHDIAAIYSPGNEESILKVIRISFDDSPDGAPTAGIYFWFNDRTVREFEELTGFNFKGFGDYDPENSVLLLGSYSYKVWSGFKIEVDQVVKDWENSLKHYELDKNYNENDWKYQVEVIEDAVEGNTFQDIKKYHFRELSPAFRQLLKTNINGLDKDLAVTLKENGWVPGAKLSGRDKRPIAELLAIKNPDTEKNVPEPGIHLKCHQLVGQIEQEAKIDLSSLGNYKESDEYLLLANYFVEPGYSSEDYSHYTNLVPYDGYLALLLNIDQEQQHHTEEQIQSPYTLRLTWEKVQNAGAKEDVLSNEVIQELSYHDVEKGIENLLSLEERLFDQETVSGLPYPFYLRKVELIDNLKDTVVLSKYQKVNETGKGMYMRFDNNQGSVHRQRIKSERKDPAPGAQGHRL